jgi:multidrug efflux system membrane fusion protein
MNTQQNSVTDLDARPAQSPLSGEKTKEARAQKESPIPESSPRAETAGQLTIFSIPDEVRVKADRHRPIRLKVALMMLLALVVLIGLFALGFVPRKRRLAMTTDAAQNAQNSFPEVNVVTAQQSAASSDLQLPGNIEAAQVAAVSARTSGYLRNYYVDIGARVHAGQLLAEIDTPEVDQELQQARATLDQMRATLVQAQAHLQQARTNMEFARVSDDRWKQLGVDGVVARQDVDQKQAAYDASRATVDADLANINASQSAINANEANVRRLEELQGYKKVYAPFAGVITARNIETGSLISAGGGSNLTASTGATPAGAMTPGSGSTSTSTGAAAAGGGLFQIARIDTLRIFVSVPQTYFATVGSGQTVDVTVRELPQKTFNGRTARSANALDPASRTLLTEVDLDNSDGSLLPGMYAQVKFHVSLSAPPVRVPANVLVIRAEGPQVLELTADRKVHYQKVELGQDYGAEVDIINGLAAGTSIITNPGDGLKEGQQVTVMPPGQSG